MAKTALYQKYRSSTFEEVVGQEYIVRSIKNAVREDKVGHAYLFCGPRGTGKTTMARLLAKAVNCENKANAPCGRCENCRAAIDGTHPDIIEINAANETHVEDIRDLIERARLAPMMGKHKIYIIDEVHQLSSAASSALLKTLEEPPENVIFVLATTDPQKLLPTIISRCQRFDFSRVRRDQIRDHLMYIAGNENIRMDAAAADMIAVLSDGGMRDALSIMDQCAAYTGDFITVEDIDRIYGLATIEEKISLIENIFDRNYAEILGKVKDYEQRGIDFIRFTDGMIDILKEVFIFEQTHNPDLLKLITKEQAAQIETKDTRRTCMHIAEKLLETKDRYRLASSAASAFEVCILSVTQMPVQAAAVPAEIPEKPVQTEAKTEEPVQEPQTEEAELPVQETPEMTPEQIVSLLVQCSKQEKKNDESAFERMKDLMGLETRKYTSILKDAKIAASGKDCILLLCKTKAVANIINNEKENRNLYFFIRDHLLTDKMLYAITEDEFRNASNLFRVMMREDRLPEACQIQRYADETKAVETPEDKVIQLFGKDNVQIIGD